MQVVERHEHVETTMDRAKQMAHAGAQDGDVVIAERMGRGRGQHGRGWHAPKGGLYLSLVIRDLDDPHLLTLAIGSAVAETLELAGVDPKLKWVNDVLLEGRKVAGVLVEAESTGDHLDFLVAGIGLNVQGSSADWPDGLAKRAICLDELLGAESCLEDLEAALLQNLESAIDLVRQGREKDILATWRARDAFAGKSVGFDPDGGDAPTMQAVCRGIDDEGRLLLEHDGVHAYDTGSLFADPPRP